MMGLLVGKLQRPCLGRRAGLLALRLPPVDGNGDAGGCGGSTCRAFKGDRESMKTMAAGAMKRSPAFE
jgi:hypothetical protein